MLQFMEVLVQGSELLGRKVLVQVRGEFSALGSGGRTVVLQTGSCRSKLYRALLVGPAPFVWVPGRLYSLQVQGVLRTCSSKGSLLVEGAGGRSSSVSYVHVVSVAGLGR